MYPARREFYSKFFIYKQTGLSQLFIVLLALILTFMSLLLTYHSLVYTSVPACALELGPCEPWPGSLARSGGSRRQSANGRRGWRAAEGQLPHRQSRAARRGCRRGRPPATGWSWSCGTPDRRQVTGVGEGREKANERGRRKEGKAHGMLFEGLFLLLVLDASWMAYQCPAKVPGKQRWRLHWRARRFISEKPSLALPFQLSS